MLFEGHTLPVELKEGYVAPTQPTVKQTKPPATSGKPSLTKAKPTAKQTKPSATSGGPAKTNEKSLSTQKKKQ